MEAFRLTTRRPHHLLGICAAAAILTTVGCAGLRSRGAILRPPATCGARGQGPDLLLGSNPETAAAAREFAFRSDWPSTPIGFYVDDVVQYSSVIYDDQTYFDSLGGIHDRIDHQVRTGLLIRD